MKKIISFLASIAMISSLFVSVVRADAFVPTVTTTVEKITAAEFLETYEEPIPTGYDAYYITVDFSNLGTLNCTNSGTSRKPKYQGRRITAYQYSMDFGEDVLGLIDKEDWTGLENGKLPSTSFGIDENTVNVQAAYTTVESAYPSEFETTINNSIPAALELLFVVDNSKTITANLDLAMTVTNYEDSAVSGEPEVCNHATMMPTASIQFVPSSGGGGSTPVITEADAGFALQSDKYVKNTETPLTDLQGRAVELKKNYGIAKFTEIIDITAKDYFLHVVDDKEEEDDLPIDFTKQGFDFESATVSFFAIVRSTTHKVVSMTLKAVAKSE